MEHLHNEHTSVVIDSGAGCPGIVYWGPALPRTQDLRDLLAAGSPAQVHGSIDEVATMSLLPESGSGYPGHPGIIGTRRDGRAWAPRLACHDAQATGSSAVYTCSDQLAGLQVEISVALHEALTISVRLTNTGATEYELQSMCLTLPVPAACTEILDVTGRWSREFRVRRRPWTGGTMTSENRRGRTSHDRPPLVFASTPGSGEWHGEVWGAHLAWSANHRWSAEVLTDGRRCLQIGELLQPGEVVLAPGERYTAPDVVAVHSASGLTPASWQFHRYARGLPAAPNRPRPVTLNTWEAVYFDHDTERLRSLAVAAAECGVERFVLDDGWFSSRRNDASGLGDWWVSREVYPRGLGPLIDTVRACGMEFGLWVEPEMVNRDSELFRQHPDWVLATEGYSLIESRNQLVLDLTNPAAFEYIDRSLHALLDEYDISFLKWDMNRDHIQGSDRDGRAASREQTLAVYRLMESLRSRHPDLEIESCASGGGRVDLGILRYAERVWASDSNDALERQLTQRGISLLIPPEAMGAHVGPERSHTTGRRHDLAFRSATAFFGHLGVECDLLLLDEEERRRLTQVIGLHKEFRSLLHQNDTVRMDHPDDSLLVHGVYARDRSEALVAVARLTTTAFSHGPPIMLPGLPAETLYRLQVVPLFEGDRPRGAVRAQPPWVHDGARLTGAALANYGVAAPALWPEQALLVHLVREP